MRAFSILVGIIVGAFAWHLYSGDTILQMTAPIISSTIGAGLGALIYQIIRNNRRKIRHRPPE